MAPFGLQLLGRQLVCTTCASAQVFVTGKVFVVLSPCQGCCCCHSLCELFARELHCGTEEFDMIWSQKCGE